MRTTHVVDICRLACRIAVVVGLLLIPILVGASPSQKNGQKNGLMFTDHTGRLVSERDFAGRYMLVFFGYTHCPDVCPGDLAIMSAALGALGAEAEAVQPVFITFDPARDTPAVLAEYVRHFHPRLVGLTGTPAQISAAATSYGVMFVRDDDDDDGDNPDGDKAAYDLRHTALTYLIDPDGKGAALFDHNTDAQEMAAKIRRILQQNPLENFDGKPR